MSRFYGGIGCMTKGNNKENTRTFSYRLYGLSVTQKFKLSK